VTVAAALILGAAGMGGCARPEPSVNQEQWGFEAQLKSLIADARAADASSDQISILERWIEIRDTPASDVDRAFLNLAECLDQVGLGYFKGEFGAGEDYPEFNYGIYASTDTEVEMMDRCERREFYFVGMAYQMGPGVSARRSQENAAHLPDALACLEAHGIVVPEVDSLETLDRWLIDQGLEDPWDCVAPPYMSGDI
jgi:hypothetical protein